MKKCPECGSEKIVKNALAIDRGDYNANVGFTIAVDENPDAFMFKQRIYSKTKAEVCGDCGFVRLFAESPDMLWSAYQNREKNSANE